MQNKITGKILYIIFFLALGIISGCASKPKYSTAMELSKHALKEGIYGNDLLARKKEVPDFIKKSLIPGIKVAEVQDKNKLVPKERFNVVAEDVDAKTFFLSLVEGTDVNVLVHPDLVGNISLKLKDVTVPEVFQMIEKIYGYSFEINGSNIKVFPAKLQAKSYKVNYLDMSRDGTSSTNISSSSLSSAAGGGTSTDTGTTSTTSTSGSGGVTAEKSSSIATNTKANFWTELKQTLENIVGTEGGRKISVSPMSGQVVVVAMPNELNEVEKFLIDSELTLNRQVILEAKILEVELDENFRSGINWGLIGKHLKSSQIGNDLFSGDSVAGNLPNNNGGTSSTVNLFPGSSTVIPFSSETMSSFGGIFSLGLSFGKFATFIEMLKSQGNVQVLSSPRVSTTNNQKAIIKVGQDEFFVTDVSTTQTTTATTTTQGPNVSFSPFFSGIALDVTPSIDDEGNVTLHVHPTVSTVVDDTKTFTLSGETQSFPLAKSTIRETDSIVRAKNGEMVVIGGLMQEKTEEALGGVPFLMDIPWVGSFFRHTRQISKKSELVILLRPIVIEKTKDAWNNQLESTYEKFESLDRGFHFGGSIDTFGTLGERF